MIWLKGPKNVIFIIVNNYTWDASLEFPAKFLNKLNNI